MNKSTTPTKKINKISFGEQGFSIGDQQDKSSSSSPTGIVRSHWKTLQSNNLCKICHINLNVKNGIVNCRKCGQLHCNLHTHYEVRLRNPQFDEKTPQYDSNGIWSRCCETCYLERQNTEVLSNNLTEDFKKIRLTFADVNELKRIKVQRNFLKLVNEGKEVTHWKTGNHCSICFVKFSLLIRKHHCRLCGDLVCDDPNGYRKYCSIYLPIISLIDRLPNLNYDKIPNDTIKFRCCINCKNGLLFELRKQEQPENEIIKTYLNLIDQRYQIEVMLEKYSKDEKIGHKLMNHLKDFEKLVINFRNQFFTNDLRVVQIENEQLIKNIYQSIAMFLQDNLIKYKEISAIHVPPEPQKEEIKPEPSLTKKQVRELREQLMVLNEQKFLIENMIKDFTKSRRFDELNSLILNKQELEDTINELENKLGEFKFI
ncbi:unnamed protein product [Candida verbasci]|uniref:FYVE-type domain-containing protein n=1 Tax=Candida verbasci TaxID=1227364 RepID=A0A9W4TZX5_9ASCO|nr:unnamed protein product [Candida verbasci]